MTCKRCKKQIKEDERFMLSVTANKTEHIHLACYSDEWRERLNNDIMISGTKH